MLKATQILVRPIVLAACTAALLGCGQRGPLYLPAEPAATLPQTLNPITRPEERAAVRSTTTIPNTSAAPAAQGMPTATPLPPMSNQPAGTSTELRKP